MSLDLDETDDFAAVAALLSTLCSSDELEADAAEELLDALLRITSTADRKVMGDAAFDPVVASVDSFSPDEPQVVEVALGVLAKLASSTQSKCNEELITLIKRVMDENEDDEPTIQEQCCLLIKGLAEGSSSNATKFLGAGIVASLDSALEKIQNVRNKKYVAETKQTIVDAMSTATVPTPAAAPATPPLPPFDLRKHIGYFGFCLASLPAEYTGLDTNRLTLAHFCIHSLKILGVLDQILVQKGMRGNGGEEGKTVRER